MANGKPGDHPFTDMLSYGAHPFPADMEEMLREVLSLDPEGPRRYLESLEWHYRFQDWQHGRNLDDGRKVLRQALERMRGKRP